MILRKVNQYRTRKYPNNSVFYQIKKEPRLKIDKLSFIFFPKLPEPNINRKHGKRKTNLIWKN